MADNGGGRGRRGGRGRGRGGGGEVGSSGGAGGGRRNKGLSQKAAAAEELPALRAAAASYVGPDSKEWEIGKKFCLWCVAAVDVPAPPPIYSIHALSLVPA